MSDGGHFDNTGVYALLKRRLDFIILLADGSADADYDLADIENLVRKARIDFGAEIDFYTHDEAARMLAGTGRELTVLSPESLADSHSARGVLLARIRYAADAAGRRTEGTLLVVKPNLHDALDLDLLAYAQRHGAFPHESTGDQSFDEAQWESYQRLGEDFGRAITLDWLARLPGWSAQRQASNDGRDAAARRRSTARRRGERAAVAAQHARDGDRHHPRPERVGHAAARPVAGGRATAPGQRDAAGRRAHALHRGFEGLARSSTAVAPTSPTTPRRSSCCCATCAAASGSSRSSVSASISSSRMCARSAHASRRRPASAPPRCSALRPASAPSSTSPGSRARR
jgi:hypothetical protein